MKLSIILPTKNNERTIGQCLEAIAQQSYKDYEVIFVDNFSSDSTLEIAKSFTEKMHIFIHSVGPERNMQRIFGAEKASGDILYFLDSDMYVDVGLFEEIAQLFQGETQLGGLIIGEENIEGNVYWTRVKAFERSFYRNDDQVEAARVFRREIYNQVGGFDERLISGEDWDISERVKKITLVGRTKKIILHDEGEIQLFSLLRKKFYYGKKFRDFSQKRSTSSTISKIYFLRGTFYRNWRKYGEKPLLFPGFIAMMSLEFIAGGFGYISAFFSKK